MAFTQLSHHASIRVSQRLTIPPACLSDFLDRGHYVSAGSVPGFNKEHLVFYSVVDTEYFVAVRNSLTGVVLTVLPLTDRAKQSWNITDKMLATAKNKAVGYDQTANQRTQSLKFIVSAHYIGHNNTRRSKLLCRVDAAKYRYDATTFINTDMCRLTRDRFETIKPLMKEFITIGVQLGSVVGKDHIVFVDTPVC